MKLALEGVDSEEVWTMMMRIWKMSQRSMDISKPRKRTDLLGREGVLRTSMTMMSKRNNTKALGREGD